jgi:hypothetical protein
MPVEPAQKRRPQPRFVARFGRLDRDPDDLRKIPFEIDSTFVAHAGCDLTEFHGYLP